MKKYILLSFLLSLSTYNAFASAEQLTRKLTNLATQQAPISFYETKIEQEEIMFHGTTFINEYSLQNLIKTEHVQPGRSIAIPALATHMMFNNNPNIKLYSLEPQDSYSICAFSPHTRANPSPLPWFFCISDKEL